MNYAEALYEYFKACGNGNAADASGAVEYTDAEGNAQSVTVPASQTAAKMASKTRERSSMPAFATGMTNDEFWAEYKNEPLVIRRWLISVVMDSGRANGTSSHSTRQKS